MSKERERIKIPVQILYDLVIGREVYLEGIDGWKYVDSNIASSDTEDGGATYEFIVSKDGRFWVGSYTDWDVEYSTDRDEDGNIITSDLDCELEEVFPKQQTITVYE